MNENIKDLEEKLTLFIQQPELAEEFGRQAKERANQYYDWDVIAGKINAVYLKVAGETNLDTIDFRKVLDKAEER